MARREVDAVDPVAAARAERRDPGGECERERRRHRAVVVLGAASPCLGGGHDGGEDEEHAACPPIPHVLKSLRTEVAPRQRRRSSASASGPPSSPTTSIMRYGSTESTPSSSRLDIVRRDEELVERRGDEVPVEVFETGSSGELRECARDAGPVQLKAQCVKINAPERDGVAIRRHGVAERVGGLRRPRRLDVRALGAAAHRVAPPGCARRGRQTPPPTAGRSRRRR